MLIRLLRRSPRRYSQYRVLKQDIGGVHYIMLEVRPFCFGRLFIIEVIFNQEYARNSMVCAYALLNTYFNVVQVSDNGMRV